MYRISNNTSRGKEVGLGGGGVGVGMVKFKGLLIYSLLNSYILNLIADRYISYGIGYISTPLIHVFKAYSVKYVFCVWKV